MATTSAIEDLEYESAEDPMTVDLPVEESSTPPEDPGDQPPPGEQHQLAPQMDAKLDIDPVDALPVEAAKLAPIGLKALQRIRARDLTIQAAQIALRNHEKIQYTMKWPRWDGIRRNRKAWRGEYPRFQDCSSFATWCLWNGLDHFGIGDVVNGARWQGGYTGTMLNHGERVTRASVLRADLLFYPRATDGRIDHVAIYIGDGMVITHGSEPGPSKRRMDYRPIVQIRRYIRE
jgi:NlpC/P60 family protein